MADTINHLDEFEHIVISLTYATDESKKLLDRPVRIVECKKKDGNDFSLWRKLYTLLNDLKPDVLHSYNLPTLEYQIVGALCGIPLRIHAEHGRDVSDPEGANKKYRLLRKLINLFVHQWVAVSQDLSNWLSQQLHISKGKITTIRNGVDTDHFKPRVDHGPSSRLENFASSDNLVIGTIGRLDAVKNQAILVDIFDEIKRHNPSISKRIKIAIIGDGPELETLSSKISDHQLEQVFWLPGARRNVSDLLNDFDLFVLPSIAEGIPITLLEAMASGLAVVASEVGGIPEVIEDGSCLVADPCDKTRFAELILRLLESPTLLKNAAEEARKRAVEHFSLGQMTSQYQALYQE